jgi:5-methylcytosine-specific restriction endonuclease McrA
LIDLPWFFAMTTSVPPTCEVSMGTTVRVNDNGHRHRKAVARQKRASTVCYLCGKPIDLTLRTPHPMSFELDHVLPVIHYPELKWDPGNHRSTHRQCNRAKSDGPVDGTRQAPTSRAWL